MRKTFCAIYRTGGDKRWEWHRTLAMSEREAIAAKDGIQMMGYVALVEEYNTSVAIGLPEGYSWETSRYQMS